MAPKVLTLPLHAVRLILDRDRELKTPAATEVLGRGDSPVSRASGPQLPQNVVTALQKASRSDLIEDRYQVALQPDEATALTGWCRTVASSATAADARVLRDTADAIDAAK